MIYLTSDWHLGHTAILKYEKEARPYTTIEEMNQTILNNYKETITDDDTVWFLGDLTLANPAYYQEEMINLPGNKIFIPGNHDRNWTKITKNKKCTEAEKIYKTIFSEIHYQQQTITYENTTISMWHFPIKGTYNENHRYYHQQAKRTAQIHAHGHMHGLYKKHKHLPQINVSVEVWDMKPVNIKNLIKYYKTTKTK